MTEKDIIRIDGVEWEVDSNVDHRRPFPSDGRIIVYLRPKRKQTGWICRECDDEICVKMKCSSAPERCPYGINDHSFKPFYGEVRE